MKKLILAAVVASVAATGFAGTANGSFAAPSAKAAGFSPKAYADVMLGYDRTNIFNSGFIGTAESDINHANGAFGFGIDAGYNFMPHLSAEAGFLMPFQKAEAKANTKSNISSYDFYAAGRVGTDVAPNINVYALAGLGYAHLKFNNIVGLPGSDSAVGFTGGFGAEYTVAQNITVGVKYLRFAGRVKQSTSTPSKVPFAGPQYFMATVGYKFG